MSNAYILHGIGGTPQENWFPWLKEQLENRGINTAVPQLPETENPNINKWVTAASSFNTGPETILIGHSLGAVLALRMLERGHQAKAIYLAAPFLHDLNWETLEESLFFADNFDWKLIKRRCPYFEVFASKNDPHVSVEDVEEVARQLNVSTQKLDINKHFNVKEFPYLLKRILLQEEKSNSND